MELKENCAICQSAMTRKRVIRLLSCLHLFHEKCAQPIIELTNSTCPICRVEIVGNEEVERKTYKKNSQRDRERVVNSANRGEDWIALASNLGINLKTAYHWVRSGTDEMLPKGGKKPKILSDEQVDLMVSWVEEDCSISLKDIQNKIMSNFGKSISVATVGNYLEGRMFTTKQVHVEPVTMNAEVNKAKRAEYVQALNQYIQEGKQVVWMDETNFNLFCRRSRGRAKAGNRAVQKLPAARGPNIHLIGAISTTGVVHMQHRRGSFTAQLANEWVTILMQKWEDAGNNLEDLVIVSDNAPCHSKLERVIDSTPASLLRLGPYSPMLNPIESIWSKIKTYAKNNIRVPNVSGPGIIEQRLVYLEDIIERAMNTITGGDCTRAVQHCTVHQANALAMNDMAVGQ